MDTDPSAAFPRKVAVKVCEGRHEVTVRPWTMAQRRELKPQLAQLAVRLGGFQSAMTEDSADTLAALFNHAEEELAEITRVSVQLPEGLTWDELLWEDLPNLVQAVWEVCIAPADGGGLAGKLVAVAGRLLTLASAKQTSTQPNVPASPSSPAAGGATQSNSGTA